MSTDLFHFVTVAGDAGRAVASACDAVIGRRRRQASEHGLALYLRRDERNIDALSKAIIELANLREPPALHCATHLDRWATSNWSLGNVRWPDGVDRALIGHGYGISYYAKEHAGGVLEFIKRQRRRILRVGRPCDTWYEDAVATAIFAGQMFADLDYTVIVASEIRGGSGDDLAVRASAAGVPNGLRRVTERVAREATPRPARPAERPTHNHPLQRTGRERAL